MHSIPRQFKVQTAIYALYLSMQETAESVRSNVEKSAEAVEQAAQEVSKVLLLATKKESLK